MSSIRWIAVLALLLVPPADGIAQSDGDKTETPQTTWGQPDLQGVWDFRSITPMQRPEDLADREFLTEEGSGQP